MIAHILIWLYNLFLNFLCELSKVGFDIAVLSWWPFRKWAKYCGKRDFTIKLPMITYPDCQACECSSSTQSVPVLNESTNSSGFLSYLSSPSSYNSLLTDYFSGDTTNSNVLATAFSEALAGQNTAAFITNSNVYKLPLSQTVTLVNGETTQSAFASSKSLPLGERVNIFNQRKNYFIGKNKIKVTFAKDSNNGKYHYDNTLTVLSTEQFSAGDLLTFINISGTTDTNYLYSADTINGVETGISGTSYNGSGTTTINVSYATSQYVNSPTIVYNLPYGSVENNY
jgi:hypothetical protein